MSKRRAVLLLRERFRSSFFAHHRDRRTSIHRPRAVDSPHCSSAATYSSSRSRASPRPAMEAALAHNGLWSSGASEKNKAMVEQLQRYGVIKSAKVAEVMEAIDRGLFVPPGASPYFDSPMAIGYNATISAPHMHAACLELLEDHLQPGMRALDVGSGTGYLTACFALMVGPEGRAVGVEHIPELVASSTENIKKSAADPQLKDGSLSIHIADGREGWPELAPYDCIHVGAAAPQIPEALIEQLKPGGRMVIPVGTVFQELKVVDKKLDGTVSVRDETSVRYVPLTSKDAQLHSN
ncbi:protein-L-isoaspartate O-methyltransferase 1 isoform X2 [Lolium perenne]|uniref:protein-L-isoaspartate O-methyltransferase 1 isoform X2 n=1 Tax=Lolium perenne TaxID=4522 RepID=UPI0021EA222A|nr:protein-L-isoaspartate O-methyltransferase 1-like isoform X2 [Lolium perenne]